MEVLVANVDHIKFDVEIALEEQYGALPLPFPGMDSKFNFNNNFLFLVLSDFLLHNSKTNLLLSGILFNLFQYLK